MAESRKKRKTKKTATVVETTVVEEIAPEPTTKELINERLKLVFGEDNIDLLKDGGVIVHFPELTIVNASDRQHDITDLYIQLYWNYNLEGEVIDFINKIDGFRSTFSDEEVYSRYSHSHLKRLRIGNASNNYGRTNNASTHPTEADTISKVGWDNFCLGSDTLSQTLSGLHMEFQIDKFYILLNTLDEFVRWESEAGGPHIRLKNIKRADNNYHEVPNHAAVDFPEYSVDKAFMKEMNKLTDLSAFDYFVDAGNISYLDTEKAFSAGEELVLNLIQTPESNFLGAIPLLTKYKDAYYQKEMGMVNISTIAQNVEFRGHIDFKMERIRVKITRTAADRNNLTKEIEEKGKSVPHPYVVSCVMDNFLHDLLKNLNKQDKWKLRK